MAAWLKSIEDRGWHWERFFGGLLFIHTPPDVDASGEFFAMCEASRG